MDKNKLQKLKIEKYTILKCCNFCNHSWFSARNDFGVCKIKTYEHEKHTESSRLLSINRYGKCSKHFELDYSKISKLNHYKEFLEVK